MAATSPVPAFVAAMGRSYVASIYPQMIPA